MVFRNVVDSSNECINLKIEGWVSPRDNVKRDYSSTIKKIAKDIKQFSFENKRSLGYKDYIVDLDMRASGISFGKKSYMKCFITLSKGETDINVERYLEYLNEHLSSNEIFEVSKEKN